MILETLRARVEARLLALWFARRPGRAARAGLALLAPFEWLVRRVAAKRARRIDALPPPPVPVIVVGNLVVGGTGKTPIAAAIARELAARGWHPGLVARGYRADGAVSRVDPDSPVSLAGDEAIVLAGSTGMPVYAAARRSEALRALLLEHPGIDVVIADDGLQHVTLPRTVSVAVFDHRGAGNGRVIPAGPLREPLSRLAGIDAVVLNAAPADGLPHTLRFASRIVVDGFLPVRDWPSRERMVPVATFLKLAAGRAVDAVAGIADPARFFATLESLGLPARTHAWGDHARIGPARLASLDSALIVMTEKDAVKCVSFADERCWALLVRAQPDAALIDWLEERLGGRPTR